MTILHRLLSHLPPFMRPRDDDGPIADFFAGLADAMVSFLDEEVRLLRARGAARRFAGEFADYYASAARQADVARIGADRLLSKRTSETWEQFEVRVRDFIGLEAWDGANQAYTVVGEVASLSGLIGIKRELERTGLVVGEIYLGRDNNDSWKVWTLEELELIPELDRAKMYALGEPVPEGQRTTKLYALGWLDWTFYVVLEQPGPPVEYSEDEIKEILRICKPVYTRAMVKFPKTEDWVEVI